MTLGALERMEEVAANAYEAAVIHRCSINGMEFRVYKKNDGKNEFDRVWGAGGKVSDISTTPHSTIIGLLLFYDLVAVDSINVSNFHAGYFFTPANDIIAVGDEIEIVREKQANLSTRWKIGNDIQAGQTRRAFQRWHVSEHR